MSGEQTIRRGVRNARYAAIPNHVFEDDRLSMEARWLLGYLLSKPDNWTVVIGDIVKRGKCGRDKARKMIAELVEVGYADREQTREDGKFSASVLVIYDEPMAREGERIQTTRDGVAFLPQTDLPATAKPSPDSPAPVKSALSNNSGLTNTDDSNLRESASEREGQEEDNPLAVERAFKRWYPSWPTYVDDSEPKARLAWQRLSATDRLKAAEMTAAYLEAVKGSGRKYICSSQVYLAEKRWEKLAELPKPAAAKKGGRIVVKALGREFSAAYFEAVLSRPQAVRLADGIRQTVLATYERRRKLNPVGAQDYLDAKGITFDAEGTAIFPDTFERDEERKLRLAEGYPMANRLAAQAQNSGEVGLPERFEGLKEAMEFVTTDSVVMGAWRAWFDDNFLPFPPMGPRGGYFPAGGPDRLDDFRAALATGSDEGEHDAA
ncbi:hypothetical protein [Rhizobium sp. AAP43]|uniref:hypothetical protein n=1 Tax=Rhizobium sp. AAP43 TaxID=1523420 RepID=UPI0006B91A9D|nr:hypothetical protein [Rhizobium sp. AAP43]